VTSDVRLPAPIDAGAHRKKTWTVCVDRFFDGYFRLGAHMEHDITVTYEPGGKTLFIPHTQEREQ
jgi:hypothetical protein